MLRQITGGFVVCSLALAGLVWGCDPAALVQCRIQAIKFLPSDPEQVTAYDVTDLVGRLKACRVSADGGAP